MGRVGDGEGRRWEKVGYGEGRRWERVEDLKGKRWREWELMEVEVGGDGGREGRRWMWRREAMEVEKGGDAGGEEIKRDERK